MIADDHDMSPVYTKGKGKSIELNSLMHRLKEKESQKLRQDSIAYKVLDSNVAR